MSQGVYVLGGKCPGGKCPGGKCPGGIYVLGVSVWGVHVRGGAEPSNWGCREKRLYLGATVEGLTFQMIF